MSWITLGACPEVTWPYLCCCPHHQPFFFYHYCIEQEQGDRRLPTCGQPTLFWRWKISSALEQQIQFCVLYIHTFIAWSSRSLPGGWLTEFMPPWLPLWWSICCFIYLSTLFIVCHCCWDSDSVTELHCRPGKQSYKNRVIYSRNKTLKIEVSQLYSLQHWDAMYQAAFVLLHKKAWGAFPPN